jgi:hypothetical protein
MGAKPILTLLRKWETEFQLLNTAFSNAALHNLHAYFIQTAYIFRALIATALQGLFLVFIWWCPFTAMYIQLVEATVTLDPQHLATWWTVTWMTGLETGVCTTFWTWLGATWLTTFTVIPSLQDNTSSSNDTMSTRVPQGTLWTKGCRRQ